MAICIVFKWDWGESLFYFLPVKPFLEQIEKCTREIFSTNFNETYLAFSFLKAFGHPMPLVSEASSYWRCSSSLQWVWREGYYFLWDQEECNWNGYESAHKTGKSFFMVSLIEITWMNHSTKNRIVFCGSGLMVIFRIESIQKEVAASLSWSVKSG